MKTGPNILITGSPATGKSTLCKLIEQFTDMKHLSVSEMAKAYQCLDGYDDERDCPIIDEEKVLDQLEGPIAQGGNIVEYHNCDFFPERFFDIVFVLTTDNTILYPRLRMRDYTGKKLLDNITCEIMAVILEEALESYDEKIVHELPSNNLEELYDNLNKVLDWIKAWKRDNGVL